ncbi:MAG: fumarate reductase subunit D [Dehalococcoidia bacterium]
MRYSSEPIFWALFSAGGVVTAFLTPVLIVLTGFVLLDDDVVAFSRLEDVFGNVLVRLIIFATVSLSFMHWANRFRHTLNDMGMAKSLFAPVSVLSYIAALAGTVWAAVVVLN